MRLPTGTVTFLFTDLAVSTRLWDQEPDEIRGALARHDTILRNAVAAHGGVVVKGRGDGIHAVFTTADAAVRAAVDCERAMGDETWPVSEPLRVRIGIHTGIAELRDGDYFGPAVNRAARLEGIAHGGQIVCSQTTADLVRDSLSDDVLLIDLGEHRLRDLSRVERVFQVHAPGLQAKQPPLRSLGASRGNLPLYLTSFVGREWEISRTIDAVRKDRFVTLTGVGGVGKTRLALQVAAELLPAFRDGAWLVELAPTRRGASVIEPTATALGVAPLGGQRLDETVAEFLGHKQLLLLLDNCEHVLDSAADLVAQVLQRCATVTVLATSREPLRVGGERVLPVGPLETAPGSAARRLFAERAAAAGAQVGVDEPRVGELCARLEGTPLAIELAAPYVRSLSVEEILERLGDGLDRLVATRRGVPDRHQTLRATIEWSYRLLTGGERSLFDRLAVCAGSFDLAAVAAIAECSEIEAGDLLQGLVLKSMVDSAPDGGGPRRHRMLDTLRAFALEQLRLRPPEFDAAREAHAVHYLHGLAALPPWRNVARDLRSEFEPDLPNILVAVDCAERSVGTSATAIGLAAGPLVFLLTNIGLFDEARRLCTEVLARDLDDLSRGRLLLARAYLEATQDGTNDFVTIAAQALEYLNPGDGAWSAAVGMTSVANQMFAPQLAVPALEEALERVHDLDSRSADHDRAVLDFYLGGALMNSRDYERAAQTLLQAVQLLDDLEPTSLVRLWSAAGAAMGLTMLGRFEDAAEVLDQVASLAGWTDWSVDWFFASAFVLARQGDFGEARATLRAIGERLDGPSVSPMAGTVVAGFGVLAHLEGRDERARALLELLAATRAAASSAVLHEMIAEIEHWSDEDFAIRRTERVIDIVQRQQGMNRTEFFASLGVSLREELYPTTEVDAQHTE